METLISFPAPKWGAFLSEKIKPFCICYQENPDLNGYGAYGFTTEKSKLLFSNLFENIKYINPNDARIQDVSWPGENGIYIYGKSNAIDGIEKSILEAKKNNLKRRLLKSAPAESQSNEECNIINIISDSQRNPMGLIVELRLRCIDFFVRKFCTPEGGDVFLIYSNEKMKEIINFCEMEKVSLVFLESMEELKPW